MSRAPVRVGVIGCGVVATVMHLPSLGKYPELFSLRAVCDLVEPVAVAAARQYGATPVRDYREVIRSSEIDAVLLLTNNDHGEMAAEIIEAGKHLFVEKPLCYTRQAADRLTRLAAAADTVAMIGYMKWFDPAYRAAVRMVRQQPGWRWAQVLSILTPESMYLDHLRLPDQPTARLQPAYLSDQRLQAELGTDSPEVLRAYVELLLDSAIHELYILRGLFGDPAELEHASLWAGATTLQAVWRFDGDVRGSVTFLSLDRPGAYFEEVTCVAEARRVRLGFPSPYLRHAPTSLMTEEVVEGAVQRQEHLPGYTEAFEAELIHFAECVIYDRAPAAPLHEGAKDIALLQEVIRAAGC